MYKLFHIISDIHIERDYPNIPKLDKIINKRCDNIILAGDIGHLELFEQYNLFIYEICSTFKNVILIPGNHEFYSEKYNYETLYNLLMSLKKIHKNLIILDNNYIDIDGNIRLYGTTLWCNIPYIKNEKELPILSNNKIIDNNWLNEKNKDCINNIHNIINKSKNDNKKLIIISHYSPTLNNINPKNFNCINRFYYFCELEHLFNKNDIYTWIYGHTHYNKDYFSPNNTRIISNQYRAKNFNKNKMIKITSKNN
jgi:predicted phosphodiesterase